VAYVRARGGTIQEPERFDYTPGRGIAAQVDGATVLVGNTTLINERGVVMPSSLTHEKEASSDVFVARAGQILGVIAVADTVRPEAKEPSMR
jgi:Cd2+/Zn2+-exporting ATPase/Cu+-exporting ATPase